MWPVYGAAAVSVGVGSGISSRPGLKPDGVGVAGVDWPAFNVRLRCCTPSLYWGFWTAKRRQARTPGTRIRLLLGLMLALVTGLIRGRFLPPAKLSYPLHMLVLWTATKLQARTAGTLVRLLPGLFLRMFSWPDRLSYPLPMLGLWTATKLQKRTAGTRFRLLLPVLVGWVLLTRWAL